MAEDRPMTVKERMAMFNKKKESPAPLEKASSGRFPKNNTTQNQVCLTYYIFNLNDKFKFYRQ